MTHVIIWVMKLFIALKNPANYVILVYWFTHNCRGNTGIMKVLKRSFPLQISWQLWPFLRIFKAFLADMSFKGGGQNPCPLIKCKFLFFLHIQIFFFVAKSSVSGLSRFKNIYFYTWRKKRKFLLICPLRHRGGG